MSTMTLREALTILGPKRVRLGMRAIDNRRRNVDSGCSCFIGEAFGGTHKGYLAAVGSEMCGISGIKPESPLTVGAALVCERYYEGGQNGSSWYGPGIPESRAELRAECVAFLAENGSAPEARVATPRDTAVLPLLAHSLET